MNRDDAYNEYTEKNSKTKWDRIHDLLVEYKRYIGITTGIIIIAGLAGWIDLPRLQFYHWFLLSSFGLGITIGSGAVLHELSDYLKDRRVRVMLAPVSSGVTDVIKIPRKTFGQFDVIGTTFPDRRLMTGGKILVARAIDFDRQIIVPAQEFDDEKYPDDLDIIGEDGDGSQVKKYRQALLDDARERHEITVDQEVIRESALGDAVDIYSKALRDVRDGDVEVEQMSDEQTEVQAEQIIQQAAESQQNSGDSNE
ncbi:hypothetical protein ACFR99_18820 [Haloarchaeobius amylolyticus]|uniref:DUF304 domain-containing protein n=1 Tax=Haloarchaeobius amylolyticus TaxID=1198296 RepID=A0ABD6BKL0_9EURY